MSVVVLEFISFAFPHVYHFASRREYTKKNISLLRHGRPDHLFVIQNFRGMRNQDFLVFGSIFVLILDHAVGQGVTTAQKRYGVYADREIRTPIYDVCNLM